MVAPFGGKSRMYCCRLSLSDSLPCSASFRMPAAVNCLVTEPTRNTMFGCRGTFNSRLALPKAFSYITCPSLATRATMPGSFGVKAWDKRVSSCRVIFV